jgi:hypothetical protein
MSLICLASGATAQSSVSIVSLETYGNFETAGVILTISGDSNWNASAALAYRQQGEAVYRPAHRLVRVDGTHFVGSLFWLTADTVHDARVTLSDPDGVSGNSGVEGTVTTRADVLAEPSLRTLYVGPGGSNSNPGTDPGAPLLTIQEAANRSQAGDLILIAPGIYREQVSVPSSGTAAQPIVFRGDGAGVVLDGADEAIAGGLPWDSEAAGVWSLVTGFSTGHVVTDQGRLFRYDDLVQLQALGAGAPGGFFFNGTRLYVKFSDGSAPAARTVHVARHENGFYIDSRSFVRVENLEIRHYGADSFGKGVYLRRSSDCAVRGSRIHENGKSGVWIKGGGRHLVEDNEFWDTSIFNWPWPWTKGSSAENTAVQLTDDVGRGNVVRHNRVNGFFNGLWPCGSEAPPSGFTNETDFHDNEVWQITDDAFEPEGYCSNVRLWGNRIEDIHMAFAVAPATVGPTFILRNTATGIGNTRTSLLDGYSGSALKINSGYPEPIGPLFLYHNTFHTAVAESNAVTLSNPGESTYIVGRNNIYEGTRYVLEKFNPVTLHWDWDLLYTTDTGRFVKYDDIRYYTLGELQAGTGQELNGVAADPLLEVDDDGLLVPGRGSPAIDRGVHIPGINDDYVGAAPDIGAVESGLLFEDGFESGDTSAWSASSAGRSPRLPSLQALKPRAGTSPAPTAIAFAP